MATCSQCGKDHSRWRDSAHTKPAAYCHDCHARYMRLFRPRHSELSEEARKRANARSYANVYLRRGKLKQLPCQRCDAWDSEMHHEDYDKPLDVTWLCRRCHLEEHRTPIRR